MLVILSWAASRAISLSLFEDMLLLMMASRLMSSNLLGGFQSNGLSMAE
jgi:hypothetical protein